MVIKRPAGGEAARLVASVVAGDPGPADAAAARLAVLGARAVPHVLHALAGDLPEQGAARLVVLLGDLPASRDTLAALNGALSDSRGAVVSAALETWGALLNASSGPAAEQALDRLTAVALDAAAPTARRTRAVRLLARALPAEELSPLMSRLAEDADVEVRASVEPAAHTATDDPFAPAANAETLRRFALASGESAPLADLHKLVVIARERESKERDVAPAWNTARATLHQVLAQRGSTVALYDLREMIAAATGPLPVPALSAVAEIGDASCLDAMADAYDHVIDEWTRTHLVEAFGQVAARHGIGRRHAALKRLAARNHPILGGLAAKPAGARGRKSE